MTQSPEPNEEKLQSLQKYVEGEFTRLVIDYSSTGELHYTVKESFNYVTSLLQYIAGSRPDTLFLQFVSVQTDELLLLRLDQIVAIRPVSKPASKLEA